MKKKHIYNQNNALWEDNPRVSEAVVALERGPYQLQKKGEIEPSLDRESFFSWLFTPHNW